MRKVTAGLFHSIDGVVEAPDQWQYDQFDDELGAMFGKVLGATDTVILGRVGYEAWARILARAGMSSSGRSSTMSQNTSPRARSRGSSADRTRR